MKYYIARVKTEQLFKKAKQKEDELMSVLYKAYHKYTQKLYKRPTIVYMNTWTYRELITSSQLTVARFNISKDYKSCSVFGMEIRINEYLENGIVIPYIET